MDLKKLIICALMVACMTITAQLWFPLPFTQVPVTLQMFGVFLTMLLMERRYATLTVLIYVIMGMFGLPVFAGFSGGFGVLFGPSGGYIWGFIPAVFLSATIVKGKGVVSSVIKLVICTIVIYLVGVWQLCIYMGLSFKAGIVAGALPFLIPDVIKAVLAFVVAKALSSYSKNTSFEKIG